MSGTLPLPAWHRVVMPLPTEPAALMPCTPPVPLHTLVTFPVRDGGCHSATGADAVAEAVQAMRAFARTQRTNTVSCSVRTAQSGRSASVSTAVPTPSASVLPRAYLEYIELEVARTVHHAPKRPAIVAAVVRHFTTMHARQTLPVELTDAIREQIQDCVREAVEWMGS